MIEFVTENADVELALTDAEAAPVAGEVDAERWVTVTTRAGEPFDDELDLRALCGFVFGE